MSEFNVQQKASIDNYRRTNGIGFVLSDEAVAELIQKEIEKSGTVYPGFEGLAKSVAKTQIKQQHSTAQHSTAQHSTAQHSTAQHSTAQHSTAQHSTANLTVSKNIFGIGIVEDEIGPFTLEKTTPLYPGIKPTESQIEALIFWQNLTGDAEATYINRENEAGALSSVVNTWKEVFDKQYAKSTVKNELEKAKDDLRLLEEAAYGQAGYTDFLGNTYTVNFEDMFKRRRGVKFDEPAIADCSEKAGQFAAIKTSVEMINQTKQTLGYTTRGDVKSAMNPEESSAAIVKAFNLCGIKNTKDMNALLKEIEAKHKDHPDIQKYGGNFRLEKNSNGQPVVMRTTNIGKDVPATNEELKIIAKEMGLRLDKALATALDVEYDDNATPEEMAQLTQQTYDKYQKEYETSFAKAYGKKDVKALAEAYVLKQQQGVANIEMGLNIASMALMVVPGGAAATSKFVLKGALAAKHTANGAKVVNGLGLVGKAKTFVKGAQTLQKASQTASPFIMANMIARPTELLEQLTSKNGMSAEEWMNWSNGVLQNSVYMAVGMGVSKIAEQGAAMYKTKALVSTLKQSGKTTDEIAAMIKANPVKFPSEIVKSMQKVDSLAKALQITSEAALDIGSTVLVNKAMGNGDLLSQDVVNSIAFAISGGALQKQFVRLTTEAKVSYLEKAFKEYGVTKNDAARILKTMDDISAGKIRAKDVKPLDNNNSNMLDEVVVTANKDKQPALTDRLATASSREDFAAIRDEIKKMPNGEEKTKLMQEYQIKYREWSTNSSRPDIRMQYKGESDNGISDAEFFSQGRELCKRPDGTVSPAATALLDAIKNSELTKKSYDPNKFNLEDFKRLSRDYKGNMISDEMLGYAKEIVECIPKGKDADLLICTDSAISRLIAFPLEHAKPEARRQIVDATKKLMANPHVRNGVIDDIIEACIEGNYEKGLTFNQKAFDMIDKLFTKQNDNGYEKFPITNRESQQDYSYSLMIAEIAKTSKYYEMNGDKKCVGEYFDDIGFEIGMMLPASDPYNRYVHYDLARDYKTQELYLDNRDRSLREHIIQTAESTYLNPKKTRWGQERHNGPFIAREYIDENIEQIRNLCMVDGKLDAQNCFAVGYMKNNLDLSDYDIIHYLNDYKNQNGVLDMSMLRLIKNAELGSHYYQSDRVLGSDGIKQSLERTNYSKIIQLGKGGGLYGSDGHVDKNIIDTIINSPNAIALSKEDSQFYKYDISPYYMTGGKIDVKKLKVVERDVKNISNRLKDLGLPVEFNGYRSGEFDSNIVYLYELSRTNPEQANEVYDLLSKIENFDYSSSVWKNGRGSAFCKSRGGQDIEKLRMYASMPADLYKVVAKNEWIEPILKGESTHVDLDEKVSRLNPADREILRQNGIDVNYLKAAQNNKYNKKSEVTPQTQTHFEKAIAALDGTLQRADVSRGIELEYPREQFEKDLIAAVKDLPPARANDVLNSYGLTLRNGKIEGVICKPKMEAPQGLAAANQKVQQYIEKFQNNRVTTQDAKLNSLYTALTKDFPEFSMLVGKVGADGQRVDTTILKQMHTLVNNPQYKTLSAGDQQMAKLALMFRGFSEIDSTTDVIAKHFTIDNDGRAIDVTHKRYKSSDFTAAILERFNLTEAEKYALGDLVAHSGWSKEFNGGIVDSKIAVDKSNNTKFDPSLDPKRNAQKVAVNTRFGTLKLSKLIEDIINPGNNVDMKAIEEAQKQVYQHMQVVNSVSAKDLEPYWETQIINGVECQVIDLRKVKLPEDFYLMGHFTQYGVENLYKILSNPNDKAFFSNSLIRPGAAKTFAGRTEGIISEFDNRNVAETNSYNIDSGFGKSYNDFVDTMSGSGCREVAKHVKEKLNLTSEEYGLLMKQIVGKRLNELDGYYNVGGKHLSRQEITDAHNEAYKAMLSSQGEQNEITILNQRPIAYAYSASSTYGGHCPFDFKGTPLKRVIIFP